MAVQIQTFRVSRVDGKSENWAQLNLIKSHKDALNEIGATGKFQGVKLALGEFLNMQVAGPKETYRVETLDQHPIANEDILLIIKVTV